MPKENYAVLTVYKIFCSLKMEEIESLLGIYIKEAETKGIKIFKFIFSYSAHMTDKSNLSYKLLLLCKALIDRNKVPIKLIMCVPGEEYISNQDQEASKKQGFEYEIIPHLPAGQGRFCADAAGKIPRVPLPRGYPFHAVPSCGNFFYPGAGSPAKRNIRPLSRPGTRPQLSGKKRVLQGWKGVF